MKIEHRVGRKDFRRVVCESVCEEVACELRTEFLEEGISVDFRGKNLNILKKSFNCFCTNKWNFFIVICSWVNSCWLF